jgi:hypothetical protein
MNDDCIDIEKIPEVLELPVGDPKRRHVETCPRCSAILASYKAFMKEEILEGSDPDDADARLSAFIASMTAAPRDEVQAAPSAEDSTRKGILPQIMETFLMRPVWVTALLVVIAAGIYGVLWWRPWTPYRTVLRSPSPVGVSQPLALSAPQELSGGRVLLEWTPMDGADSYQVRLYGGDFNGIALLEPTSETTFVIDRSLLPADTPDVLIWRVFAFRRGDEIGSSDPASLELR